jgi:hypothetical protein
MLQLFSRDVYKRRQLATEKESGITGSSFLSALFPSAAQAHAAAELLERRGAVLLTIETVPGSAPDPARLFSAWPDWISISVSSACAILLALATICVPGVGYALALAALVTLTLVRPHEIEDRLLVRDRTLNSGGAELNVSPGPLQSQGVIRLLERHGAIDVSEQSKPVSPN